MSDMFIWDSRPMKLETREIARDGKILCQGRGCIINPDGSIEYTKWETLSVVIITLVKP